jgi:hypothetical protein
VCHISFVAVHWIFKNKDHGKTSATASLGLISLWDVEGGLPIIDKYVGWVLCLMQGAVLFLVAMCCRWAGQSIAGSGTRGSQ